MLEKWLGHLANVTIMGELEQDFAVIKDLGEGGYGIVRLIQELEDGHHKYAVKSMVKDEIKKKSRGMSAVISEIEIMQKIKHPSFVSLHRIYENEKYIHLIMEYVEGGSLFHRFQRGLIFSEEKAAKFMKDMLEALNYMHSLEIVHRDIKPENILMISNDDDTKFKICDFGLAYVSGQDQTLRCGSPGYVAPEILKKKSYNHKVDIFSAGIICYILLSGRNPFTGHSHKEILMKNEECRFYFSDEYWGHVSREGVDFVLKLTDPDPESRYSAEQALKHP